MALHRDKSTGIYSVDITIQKRRIQRSTFTTNKDEAKRFHEAERTQLYRAVVLKEKPRRTFKEARDSWTKAKELEGKRSLAEDCDRLDWVGGQWDARYLDEITGEDLMSLRQLRAQTKKVYTYADGTNGKEIFLKPATLNRYMAAVSGVLHFAKSLGWMAEVPTLEKLEEDNERIVWASAEQAYKLIAQLKGSASHLSKLARFTLATGVRKSNSVSLRWQHINAVNRRAMIPAAQFKNGHAFAYPLNDDALAVIEECKSDRRDRNNEDFVFVYEGRRIGDPYTAAFKKGCARAELLPGKVAGLKAGDEFHWHDLRHTWATWHAMGGTPIHVLKELGGWKTLRMVERYYHLADSFTAGYAENVSFASVSRNVHVARTAEKNIGEESVNQEDDAPEGASNSLISGVADGTRTHDNRNHNPVED